MKKWLSLILAATLMFYFTNLVFAFWPDPMEGEPTTLLRQHLEGYFIWHDSSGVHLKVEAATGTKHIFTGVIETDGRIENLMTKTADTNDYSKLSDHDTLKFQLTASDQVSAIDFGIFDGQSVRFELSMDGRKIDGNKIYFGRDGWHPNDAIFSIDYDNDHPDHHGHANIYLGWPWWPGPGPWGALKVKVSPHFMCVESSMGENQELP
ncbi:MAG TPA: hypothetical protein DDW50_14895 [Firmicutes bacterium]|jgi:hypothetical protein|nr:hypothetical protein [Bacillota bacterium]